MEKYMIRITDNNTRERKQKDVSATNIDYLRKRIISDGILTTDNIVDIFKKTKTNGTVLFGTMMYFTRNSKPSYGVPAEGPRGGNRTHWYDVDKKTGKLME